MPPSVACALVETSTGNHRPCGLSCALRWSSTMPGSTSAVIAFSSSASTLRRCLLASMTSAAPTVCPHCEVPPPRGSSGTPRSRAMSRAAATSSGVRGTNTPTGIDLVDRRVGRVAAARGGVEQHLALRSRWRRRWASSGGLGAAEPGDRLRGPRGGAAGHEGRQRRVHGRLEHGPHCRCTDPPAVTLAVMEEVRLDKAPRHERLSGRPEPLP